MSQLNKIATCTDTSMFRYKWINTSVDKLCKNTRRTDTDGIFVDGLLYAERYSVERTNAWMDSYRTLLNRFDTTVTSWESWNYLAFAVLLLKKISRKRKV